MAYLIDYKKGFRNRALSSNQLTELFSMIEHPEEMLYNVNLKAFDPVRFFNQERVRLHVIMEGTLAYGLAWVTKYNEINQSGWVNLAFFKGTGDKSRIDYSYAALQLLLAHKDYRLLFAELETEISIFHANNFGFTEVGVIPEARWVHKDQSYHDVVLVMITNETLSPWGGKTEEGLTK